MGIGALSRVAHEDDEDITWTSEYERSRPVYTKGSGVLPETNNSCYEQLHVQCPEGPTCLKIPNIGWQAETLLHHIIERYDTLASVTFLVHGGVNYQPGTMLRAHKEDLRAGEWLWRDFISTDPNFFHYMKCGQDGPQTTFYDYNETLVDALRICKEVPRRRGRQHVLHVAALEAQKVFDILAVRL